MIESDNLFKYSDSFCFYVESHIEKPLIDNAVMSRFRKTMRKNRSSADLVAMLNELINQFEDPGSTFVESLKKSIANESIVRLSNINFGNGMLVELRLTPTKWRVLSYLDEQTEMIVMIDAMEAHVHKTIAKFAKGKKHEIEKIEEIIEKEHQDGC